MLGLLLIAALLIFINLLFVLMEYALVRIRPSGIELLARKGLRSAQRVQEMLAHLDDYLAAIQIGITSVALALGAFAEPGISAYLGAVFEHYLGDMPDAAVRAGSFALALGFLTYFQIVIGELVPRAIAIQKAEAIVLWGSLPLKLFASFCRLLIRAMSSSSRAILRFAGFKPAAQAEMPISEEEMRILLGETQERGTLPLERLLLLENLFDFGSDKVSETMIPRE